MRAILNKRYLCQACGNVHYQQDKANSCCPPRTLEFWECSGCGIEHDRRTDAETCCEDDD